jgi:hypothetical protein
MYIDLALYLKHESHLQNHWPKIYRTMLSPGKKPVVFLLETGL